MNRYDGLMKKLAGAYQISQGDNESIIAYKSRLLYSHLGAVGREALWDQPNAEGDISVSIQHFKSRISSTLDTYLELYPELRDNYVSLGREIHSWHEKTMVIDREESGKEDLAFIPSEIYSCFLQTGQFYHGSRRVKPVVGSQAFIGAVWMIRGGNISAELPMSGLGYYSFKSAKGAYVDMEPARLFALPEKTYAESWDQYVSRVSEREWENHRHTIHWKYLRLKAQKDTWGAYWVDSVLDKSRWEILLAKETVDYGTRYYLYRVKDGMEQKLAVPSWRADKGAILELSNGCLMKRGVLPATRYSVKGEIVHLKLGYYYPLALQNLLLLYSWPVFTQNKVSITYERIVDTNVFYALKELFMRLGFKFEETREH